MQQHYTTCMHATRPGDLPRPSASSCAAQARHHPRRRHPGGPASITHQGCQAACAHANCGCIACRSSPKIPPFLVQPLASPAVPSPTPTARQAAPQPSSPVTQPPAALALAASSQVRAACLVFSTASAVHMALYRTLSGCQPRANFTFCAAPHPRHHPAPHPRRRKHYRQALLAWLRGSNGARLKQNPRSH